MTCLLTLIAIDLCQHKLRVDADLTRLVIWHFLVTLDLPWKISACFCRKCILSEMRWNSARIIKFPGCRSLWINGRERRRSPEREVLKTFCMHIWKNTKVWRTGINIPHQQSRLPICLHPLSKHDDPALLGAFHLQHKQFSYHFRSPNLTFKSSFERAGKHKATSLWWL